MEHPGWGFAPAVGPASSRLLFVGEALGYEEAIAGEPFYGAAGGVLSRVLVRAGIDRNHVRIANVVSCFPGDTLIQAEGLRGAYRRYYDGSLVTITTNTGVFSATPNHPVLTPTGWVEAGAVHEGMDLVRGSLSEGRRSGYPHVDHPPVRIEEAFQALSQLGVTERIVGANVDFHGDGSDAEIEVVSLDGLLGREIQSALSQHVGEHVLVAADNSTRARMTFSAVASASLDLLARLAHTANGVVGLLDQMLTLPSGAALPPESQACAAIARDQACLVEEIAQALLPYTKFVGQSLHPVPIAIEATRVIKVERLRYSGHVYNLATLSEQYMAEGHIVHNCRPPNDYLAGAPWEFHAISQCRQYLQPVIDQLPQDGVIVPLGATALGAILNLQGVAGIAVKDFHGTVSRSPDGRHWVVPNFHPSHLQRGAMSLLDVVTEDVKTAERVSRQGFVRSLVRLVVDPDLDYFRAWVTDHLAKVAADPDAAWLALDTEFEGKPNDESEILVGSLKTRMTRINVANSVGVGITVPYSGEYIRETERLLAGIAAIRGIVLLWNKYADWAHLAEAGHTLDGIEAYDLMWLWHHLHSDLPRGLGFVAPMASDFGAWKHWSQVKEREGEYAAADGVQTYRCGVWLIKAALQLGMWEMFVRDWHERDQYCLRPAHVGGVPIDRVELEEFHKENQEKLGRILVRIKETAAQGVLKPKQGYAKRPKGKFCGRCERTGFVDQLPDDPLSGVTCTGCGGTGTLPPVPPASILGKSKTGGAEAKSQYMLEGVKLVERDIEVEINYCVTCGAEAVGPKHRCALPKRAAVDKKARKAPVTAPVNDVAGTGAAVLLGGADARGADDPVRPVAEIRQKRVAQSRYFWQLPFNPDAPAQVLAYIASQGIALPFDKKKQKATTNKQAMKKLAKDHSEDPFFSLKLDWSAVAKVDSTYAVGTLRRLDGDDRVHPEYLPKPSTLRDSAMDPNLTNVVADKTGPESLAGGFRRCITSRDGVPPGVTAQELAAWQERWGGS